MCGGAVDSPAGPPSPPPSRDPATQASGPYRENLPNFTTPVLLVVSYKFQPPGMFYLLFVVYLCFVITCLYLRYECFQSIRFIRISNECINYSLEPIKHDSGVDSPTWEVISL